jgi:2-polyprenyl-3-methyl-5-hydroxy-6-metoxy-1,4-benzoquinol methylase
MLEVDGSVISAEVLVQRVQELVAAVDAQKPPPQGQPGNTAQPIEASLHAMALAHGELNPPDLDGARGPRGRVGAFVKRAIRRLTSWYVEPRWAHQHEFDGQAIATASSLTEALRRVDAELAELQRQNASLRLQAVTSSERAARAFDGLERLDGILSRQADVLERAAMKDELAPIAREITALLDRLGAIGASGAEIDYTGFEDLFRGESSALEKTQERYLTLFPPPGDPGRIVDIGCGRGEMLTLLTREGHEVIGVDLDTGMVDVCLSKALPAVVDDGIHFLSQVADDSLKGIFCAQVVEHLITPELERLIRLAHRTLRVSGVLVVETINPRSSFALGNHFFADTSHVRPVHPETLRYICEQIGFSRVQLEERSPHPALELTDELPEGPVGDAVGQLLQSVFGYQDYVIVATK